MTALKTDGTVRGRTRRSAWQNATDMRWNQDLFSYNPSEGCD